MWEQIRAFRYAWRVSGLNDRYRPKAALSGERQIGSMNRSEDL